MEYRLTNAVLIAYHGTMTRQSMQTSRREILAGAAAVTVTVVLPAVPLPTPTWLVEARAAMDALGPSRSRFSTPWCALSLLSHGAEHGGLEPDIYAPDQRPDLAYALEQGWATLEADGRLMITKLGQAEWELELFDSYV